MFQDRINRILSGARENPRDIQEAPQAPTAPTKAPTKAPAKPKKEPKWDPNRKWSPKPGPNPRPKAKTPVAPTKTPTKAPTKSPSKPKKEPKWDPNRKWSPKPGPNPRPKALVQITFLEEYGDEVNPSISRFWSELPGGDHPYSKHPIMSIYGDTLSKAGYQHTKDRMDKVQSVAGPQLQRMIYQIMRLEAAHKEELENAAVQVVSEIWGVPDHLLHAMLTTEVESAEGEDEEEEQEERGELTPELAPEVNKRVTMNTMTQGAAIHSMMTAHHMAKQAVNAIDPDLISLYDKFSSGSHGMYWIIDFAAMMEQLAGMQIGSSSLKFDDETPQIEARAIMFPILIQELIKGVMELLTYHHISDLEPETGRKVIQHADRLEHEPWQIQIGPELWRRFLKVANQVTSGEIGVADIIGALSTQPPDDVHKIVMLVLDDKGEEALELLNNLVAQPEEFDVNEYDDWYGNDEEAPAY